MKMRQSLADWEQAFVRESTLDRRRRASLQQTAERRMLRRAAQRRSKRGSLRFLLLVLTLTWVMPWYIAWLLPFAALSRQPRLRAATLACGAFLLIVHLPYPPN